MSLLEDHPDSTNVEDWEDQVDYQEDSMMVDYHVRLLPFVRLPIPSLMQKP